MKQLPAVRTDTDYFAFQGGTDLVTPAIRVPPGSVLESSNYEPVTEGGYARCKGYEVFDGRTSPSDATYTDLACTLNATLGVGSTVHIGGNYCLQSEDLSSATWTAVNAKNVTSNTTVSPDGTTTADTLSDVSAAAYHGVQQVRTVANDDESHCFSIYVLKTSGGTAPTFGVNLQLSGGTTPITVNFRLNTDTGSRVGASLGGVSDAGTYWRVWGRITNNISGNTLLYAQIFPATSASGGGLGDTVAATGSAVVWGMQWDYGTTPGPYYKTTTTAVVAATALFVKTVTGGCILTSVTGTIPASAPIIDPNYVPGPAYRGTTAASTSLTTPITPADEAQNLVAAADVYRALIAAPAGSGAIRGVVLYAGSVYCFRDNVGGTAGQMYKATTGGWVLQSLGESVAFSNANTSVGDGDVLTQGGVTATVNRVVVETGSLASGVNTGRLIISGRSGGNFAAGAATSTGGGALTLSGAQTAITLPAGGRYVFDIYNFGGQLTSQRLYGANGVGKAFEWDGTVFVPLNTGASTDTPSFVKANRKYLYWAVGSSVIGSSVGNPYRVVASEGAAEFAVGDTVTGLVVLTGDALGIMCRNSSHALYGSSSSDWTVKPIRADVGGVAYTVESMSNTLMLDDRGVTSFEAAQEFGNFADATLSRRVQPLIDALRGKAVASYVSRQRGLYVLLMNDGTTLTMGMSNRNLVGFMPGQLDIIPTCAFSGEDSSGIERIFVGASDGNVYEMNKGSTFNGGDIESYLRIYYYHSKSPRVRKTYRALVLEMTVALYTQLSFRGELTYGDPRVQQMEQQTLTTTGTGGAWDSVLWDAFFWDSQSVNQPRLRLEGTGLNLALSFYSKTKLDFGHTLQGGIIHYTARRIERG